MNSFLKILTDQNFRDYLKQGNFLNKNIGILINTNFFPAFLKERINGEEVTNFKLMQLGGCEILNIGISDISFNDEFIYYTKKFYGAAKAGKYYYYQIDTNLNSYYSELFNLEDFAYNTRQWLFNTVITNNIVQDSYEYNLDGFLTGGKILYVNAGTKLKLLESGTLTNPINNNTYTGYALLTVTSNVLTVLVPGYLYNLNVKINGTNRYFSCSEGKGNIIHCNDSTQDYHFIINSHNWITDNHFYHFAANYGCLQVINSENTDEKIYVPLDSLYSYKLKSVTFDNTDVAGQNWTP